MGSKLEIEEVRARGLEKGFVLLSDSYINVSVKLQWRCSEGHVIEMRLNGIDVGNGCFDCSSGKKYETQEVRAIGLKMGFTLLSDNYTDSRTKLRWKCPNGHITEKRFDSVRSGHKCFECVGKKTLTIEEVRTRGLERGFILLSDSYVNANSKLQWKCNVGHIIEKNFNSIDQDHGCSVCLARKFTIERVRARGLEKGFILLSDSYVNANSKLQWKCPKDHIFGMTLGNISQNYGCSRCTIFNKTTPIEQVRTRGLERGFILLSDTYVNSITKLRWQCPKGHTTEKTFHSVNQKQNCFICYNKKVKKYDKAQSELYQFVLGMYPDALDNRSGFLKSKRLQLDIYIPSLRKAIELDGEHWHSKPEAIERDSRKDRECQEAGIELLRIGYYGHWHEQQETVGKPMVYKFLKGLNNDIP